METGTLAPPTLRGEVTFSGVTFAYPSRPLAPVVRDLTLSITAGEHVALVGPSGGGKSTIFRLLLRQYAPDAGEVLLDGRDVGQYDFQWRSRHVAVVSQEPQLFDASIGENIVFGWPAGEGDGPPTMDHLVEAARHANCLDFILALPDGFDTEVGEQGAQLSGGQKQRVALARAFIRRPSLLLLE